MDVEHWISLIRKHVSHQQRLILCIFGFLAVANAYAMQHSFELIVMKLSKRKLKKSYMYYENQVNCKRKSSYKYFKRLLEDPYKDDSIETINCKGHPTNLKNATIEQQELHALLMISFYIGYAIAQVPGCLLSERFKAKTILALCLTLTALLTFTTPFVITYCSTMGLIVLRILMGFSEGPIFPALTVMMIEKLPESQRATFSSFILSAGNLGVLITNLLSGFLMPQYEWPILFYFFGICCLLWLVGFIIFCYNDSEENSNMKEIELKRSHVTIKRDDSALCTTTDTDTVILDKNACTPWKDIFTNSSVWALIMANIQHDWSQLILKNDVNEIFMKWNDENFQESFSTHCKATIPFILNWFISIMAGIVSDILINNNILDTTEVRQLMTMIAAFGPKICTNFISCLLRTECNDFFSLINCAINTTGAYYAGSMITAIDLSPNYAGTLMAILNIFGSLMNILAPFLENFLRQSGSIQNLRSLIWLLCTMFTSGEVQAFNEPTKLIQTTT